VAPPPSRSFCDFVLQVLDERSVKCLFSKVWGFRDEGISSVVNSLPNLGVDKVHVFRSIVSVIKRGLSDKIPQVYVFFQFNLFPPRSFRVCLRYYSSLRLLQVFCDEAAKTARAGDVMAVVEPLVAALVAKLQVSQTSVYAETSVYARVSSRAFCFCCSLGSSLKRMQDANMRTNKDTSDVLLALAANKSVGCAAGAPLFSFCRPVSIHVSRFGCSRPPAAQASQVAKRVAARAVAPADHHTAAAG
jgi:hypothetical protein